jgi:hypothetical protein
MDKEFFEKDHIMLLVKLFITRVLGKLLNQRTAS